ncbi:TIGR04290 family methyltransferase [Anaeromyxobacter diazotrophicus]|uniref:Methyltransferase, TIGR04290 family protein n=1 Tax=Anaeromyxobacter diazotrophicus TaxID=2590199 RepID=A0A7I9VPF4_9BACT|nr:TIGR04290 family methyltransferase [Anaeromyxobacter diazotrophicus]GEJ58293.1 methyltransferase, TIGR04290 family protein [Anaeromyxobacter diazotrophicus]
MSRSGLSRQEIERRVHALGDWFHNLDLGGVRTAPDHFLGDYPAIVWRAISDALPARLDGRTVLDVGCNAGFFSLEMKRRGAARVVGLDSDERYLAQARLASEVSGLELELRQLSVYDVARLGERFDLVLFMGVLYHLRHPLLALDLLHEHAVGETLVFQSMLRGSQGAFPVARDYPFDEREIFDHPSWPKLHFVEHAYARDWTNWWIPNRAGAEALLRASGFEPRAVPGTEVYLCRRGARPTPDGAVYPARGPAAGEEGPP